ncbi:MAG: succinate dehydrogenase assembly factor 2 [Cycloclasticus sp.]|jgi:antitoxin CptB|nr:succinate dehydrogenase assembly factor 2 [Cycloclasticus sp.]MDF1689995.1 succinate dehydrogenase assembly factor 2 [Cycloclasticus sp.]MEE4290232.1 succinate dehydrogenase assembly factor 2 [Cycloclasticus sp.]
MSEKSKLLWRCRRGVKELDVLFTRFVELSYDGLSEREKEAFNKLLEIEDPDILGFMLYNITPDDPDVANIVEKIHTTV